LEQDARCVIEETRFQGHYVTHDPCTYIKFVPGGRRLVVLVYVGDCAITGDPDTEIEELISSIKEGYSNKIGDLGELEWFLGMIIQRDRKKRILSIYHSRYIMEWAVPEGWRCV
jgi:hypothetical protein